VKPSAAAIFRAARFGDVEKIKALLNADPGLVFAKDKDGLTPLHIAAWKGRAAVVELLLSHKADVNARDADGETPLHYATPASSKDVRNLLRQHGGSE
jgi:ankyrin repeat protein